MEPLAFPFPDSPPLDKTENPTTTTRTKKEIQRLCGFEFLEYIIHSCDTISNAQPLLHLGISDTSDTTTGSQIVNDFAPIHWLHK